MVYIYKIINLVNQREYIGITRSTLNRRWNNHVYWSKTRTTPLYNAIKKYGLDNFKMIWYATAFTWNDACLLEQELIAEHTNLYNLASGGQGGFNVQDIASWKEKLSTARKGRQPFLNKNHTDETKAKCGKAAKDYWSRIKSSDLG